MLKTQIPIRTEQVTMLDVELPCYYQSKDGKTSYAILTTETMMQVMIGEYVTQVCIYPPTSLEFQESQNLIENRELAASLFKRRYEDAQRRIQSMAPKTL